MTAAELLDISPVIILSLQTFGGAIGSAMAPGSILLGISTTGMEGGEGRILKKIIPIVLSLGIAMGMIALVLVNIF